MKELSFFIFMLCVVIFFGVVIQRDDVAMRAEKVIAQCEATLPRNQHCVLTAVPEGTK